MENDDPKINESTKWLMLGVAIFFDTASALINLIPIVGQAFSFFVGLFATMTFWLWFKINGMNFAKPKNVFGLAGGSIIEMIPVLNALPAWTATILYLTRVEKVINKTIGQVPGGKMVSKAIAGRGNISQADGISTPKLSQNITSDKRRAPL